MTPDPRSIGRERWWAALGRLPGRQVARLLRSGAWAVADQGLISAANFVTLALVARSVVPAEFGWYAVATTVLLFANNVQAALVTQPHGVQAATTSGEGYTRYTTAATVMQLVFAAALAAVCLSAAGVASMAASHVLPLLLALAPAVLTWQLQEFARRVLYTEGRPASAFATDVVSYGGQVTVLAGLWAAERLTSVSALYAMAATSLIAAVWGIWLIRSSLRPTLDLRLLGEHWRFARWLLAATLAQWASGHAFPFLVAGLVGLVEAGIFRAVQLVLGPTHVLLNALTTWSTPVAARAHAAGGQKALGACIARIGLVTGPLMALYCLAVGLFAGPLLGTLFGEFYAPYGWLLAFFALCYALCYLSALAGVALQAAGATASVFEANVWSALAVLSAGVVGVYLFGLLGAIAGSVLHQVVLNVVLWRRMLQTRPRPRLDGAVAATRPWAGAAG